MFGKKILTKIFAVLLFISLLISTFIPQLAFAGGGSPGEDPPQVQGDVNMITVKKEFVGIEKKHIPENFTITLLSNGDHTYELKDGNQPQNIVLEKSNNGLVWTWKISNAGEGTYTVSEENTAKNGYGHKSTDISGSFTIKKASYQIDSDLITPNNNQVFNIYGNFIFAAALTGNLGTVVITPNQLSVEQQGRIIKYILNDYSGNWNGNRFYFHDISSEGNEFSITKNNGNQLKITYNASAATMTFNDKSDWSHVAKLTYAEIPAVNAVIKIVNTYAIVLPDPSELTTADPTATEAPTTTTTSTEATAATTSTPETPTTEESTTTSTEETVATTTTTEASTTKETTTTTTEETVVTTTTTEASTTEETTTTTTEETAATTSTTEIPTTEETTTTTTAEDTTTTTTEASAIETVTTEEQVAPHIPPVISVEKFVKEKKFTKAGDKLHYSFIVKNDGIVPVVKLTVNDSLLGIEKLVINLADNPLMPDDSYTYELPKAYLVTEADLEAGKVANVLAVIAETEEGAKSEAEADVTTPWEQVSPQTPDLPQTGEYTGYRAGIYSLLLGGAVVLVAINRRKKISYQSDNAD